MMWEPYVRAEILARWGFSTRSELLRNGLIGCSVRVFEVHFLVRIASPICDQFEFSWLDWLAGRPGAKPIRFFEGDGVDGRVEWIENSIAFSTYLDSLLGRKANES